MAGETAFFFSCHRKTIAFSEPLDDISDVSISTNQLFQQVKLLEQFGLLFPEANNNLLCFLDAHV